MAKTKKKNSAEDKFDALNTAPTSEGNGNATETDAFGDAKESKPTGERKQRPAGMEVVSNGAGYHNWDKQPVFEGSYLSNFLAPNDIPANKTKKGDVIGYNFTNHSTGEIEIISNNYSIEKALEEDGFSKKTLWWFEFLEKVTIKGKPFSKFYIAKQK